MQTIQLPVHTEMKTEQINIEDLLNSTPAKLAEMLYDRAKADLEKALEMVGVHDEHPDQADEITDAALGAVREGSSTEDIRPIEGWEYWTGFDRMFRAYETWLEAYLAK